MMGEEPKTLDEEPAKPEMAPKPDADGPPEGAPIPGGPPSGAEMATKPDSPPAAEMAPMPGGAPDADVPKPVPKGANGEP